MHAVSNSTIQFGLVSIPVKIYSTASPKQVSFNWLTPSGSKTNQKLFDSSTGLEIDRADVSSGYEYEKGKFVSFSKEELALIKKGGVNDSIEVCEAVKKLFPDPKGIEKSYQLLPNKSDKSYRLLHSALKGTSKSLVGKWSRSGKDNLVMLLAEDNNLLSMYQLYYEEELHQIDPMFSPGSEPSAQEVKFAKEFLNKISEPEFILGKYKDEYKARLENAIQKKLVGEVITSDKQISSSPLLDLLGLLKQSISQKMER